MAVSASRRHRLAEQAAKEVREQFVEHCREQGRKDGSKVEHGCSPFLEPAAVSFAVLTSVPSSCARPTDDLGGPTRSPPERGMPSHDYATNLRPVRINPRTRGA